MKAVLDDRQWRHEPQYFMANGVVTPSPEQSTRIARLTDGAKAAGCDFIAPQDAGLGPIAAVHTPEYVTFLRNIYTRWQRIEGGGEEVIPNIHPANRSDSYPKSAVGQAGYHQADTACPIGAHTWEAAYWGAQSAVTGADLVRETLARWETRVEALAGLGFGRADLVIAVPDAWVDVDTLDDLDMAAADFRAAHGHRLRIATKYHRLVREFLRARGVADYRLVDSQGATEGTVRNLTAEAIADITSTGETLRANHLKILSDGLVLRSEATLYRSRAAPLAPADARAMAALLETLGLG